MKIILKKEVANLGEVLDVVEVKAGYAQNYLIPQGFAIAATSSALKMREETIRQRAHKEAKLVADAEALAAKVAATPSRFPSPARSMVPSLPHRLLKLFRLPVSRSTRRTSPFLKSRLSVNTRLL